MYAKIPRWLWQKRPKGGHLSNRGWCKLLSGSEVVCITHGSAILSSSLEATPFDLAHVEGVAFSDWSWFIMPPMNQPTSLCSAAWFIGGYPKATLRVSIDWQINRFYNSANGYTTITINRFTARLYFLYFLFSILGKLFQLFLIVLAWGPNVAGGLYGLYGKASLHAFTCLRINRITRMGIRYCTAIHPNNPSNPPTISVARQLIWIIRFIRRHNKRADAI